MPELVSISYLFLKETQIVDLKDCIHVTFDLTVVFAQTAQLLYSSVAVERTAARVQQSRTAWLRSYSQAGKKIAFKKNMSARQRRWQMAGRRKSG